MVTAIVLLKIARGQVPAVAESVAELDGVSEVYSVGGRYDLVAMVRVKDNDRLADLVAGRLQNVDGIESTETLIAFKAYSRHDLERMFAIGAEE